MSKFTKGQTVILSHRRGHEEVTIERVGRKWVYIKQYSREVAFDAETGVENSNYGAPDRIYTPEMWAENDRRQTALDGLKERGVQWKFGGYPQRYSTDVLEQVLALLSVSDGR